MDLRRVHIGEWALGLAGAALVVSLFLPWLGPAQGISESGPGWTAYAPPPEVSGWEWLSAVDILLAGLALAAITALVLSAVQQTAAMPLALTSLTTLVGLVLSVVLAIRLITAPDGASLEYGAWIGLAATLMLTGAGLYAMRDEHVGAPSRGERPEALPAP